jgi:hypothetical protein
MSDRLEDLQATYRRLKRALCFNESIASVQLHVGGRFAVLTLVDGNGWTPLHWACYHAVSSAVVSFFILHGSIAASMADDYGRTPLHWACRQSHEGCFEIIRLLRTASPDAIVLGDNRGYTPIHNVCSYLRQSPDIIHYLLDYCPPRVLGIQNTLGYTPLHVACSNAVSVAVLGRMVALHVKALGILSNEKETPLHLACRSRRTLHGNLVDQYPAACLVVDTEKHEYPYEMSVRLTRLQVDHQVEYLHQVTKEAAIALLVICSRMRCDFILTHIQAIPNLASITPGRSALEIRDAVEPHLDLGTLKALLQQDDLQDLLQTDEFREMINGVMRMIQISPSVEDLSSLDHINVLESVTDNPGCLYLHLRNDCACLWCL